MRVWVLKLVGFLMWSLFLFAPFVVRAEDGFDTYMMKEITSDAPAENVLLSLGGFDLQLDNRDNLQMPIKDKWSFKVKAGRDSVLTNDQPALIRHDRVPLDDGSKGLRFGVGLNYSF